VITFANGSHQLRLPGFAARVRSAKVYEASTPSGRARRRMRVAVALEASATGERAAMSSGGDGSLALAIGATTVHPDSSFDAPAAFALSRPVPPGESRRGEVRFELAGATSARFLRAGAQLRITPFGAPAGETKRVAISRIRPPKKIRSLPQN
jgi:hypothetical protein